MIGLLLWFQSERSRSLCPSGGHRACAPQLCRRQLRNASRHTHCPLQDSTACRSCWRLLVVASNPCGEHTQQKCSEWKDAGNLALCFCNENLSFCLMLLMALFLSQELNPKQWLMNHTLCPTYRLAWLISDFSSGMIWGECQLFFRM